jgi:hypothetical protein
MNLIFINSILLVTLFLDSVFGNESKCISNETIGTTSMIPTDENIVTTKINLQAFLPELAACSCADKCQYTKNCVYFESNINSSFYYDCFFYQFNTPITQQLKNNLRRGIYYAQSFNMACGLSNILF